MPVRRLLLILFLVLALPACSHFAKAPMGQGLTREQVVDRMGPPESERQVAGLLRLEYPGGPYGKQTWFVYFDGSGRVSRAEQALTEQTFNLIQPGMPQDQVRLLMGRPGEVRLLARQRGVIWSYRYENTVCNWFQVELSAQQEVRSAGYGQPPECEMNMDRSN
jgi:hypothetical protein